MVSMSFLLIMHMVIQLELLPLMHGTILHLQKLEQLCVVLLMGSRFMRQQIIIQILLQHLLLDGVMEVSISQDIFQM